MQIFAPLPTSSLILLVEHADKKRPKNANKNQHQTATSTSFWFPQPPKTQVTFFGGVFAAVVSVGQSSAGDQDAMLRLHQPGAAARRPPRDLKSWCEAACVRVCVRLGVPFVGLVDLKGNQRETMCSIGGTSLIFFV